MNDKPTCPCVDCLIFSICKSKIDNPSYFTNLGKINYLTLSCSLLYEYLYPRAGDFVNKLIIFRKDRYNKICNIFDTLKNLK